jgi:hypothetical protein
MNAVITKTRRWLRATVAATQMSAKTPSPKLI